MWERKWLASRDSFRLGPGTHQTIVPSKQLIAPFLVTHPQKERKSKTSEKHWAWLCSPWGPFGQKSLQNRLQSKRPLACNFINLQHRPWQWVPGGLLWTQSNKSTLSKQKITRKCYSLSNRFTPKEKKSPAWLSVATLKETIQRHWTYCVF